MKAGNTENLISMYSNYLRHS